LLAYLFYLLLENRIPNGFSELTLDNDLLFGMCCYLRVRTDVISEEAVLQWAALRESLEEDEAEEAAEGNPGSVLKVIVGGETVSIRGADRVKLFREPTVQALVAWVQEDEESSDEDGEEEGSSEEGSDEEED